jgi:hypothetical protein
MGDGEAFKLFLGGQIRRNLSDDAYGPDIGGASGIFLGFRGQSYTIEHILYKFYRCELIHEGGLPNGIEFRDDRKEQHSAEIDLRTDRVALDAGWINLLTNAVVRARVNRSEFQVQHYDFVARVPDEAAFTSTICERYDITPGRFEILKLVVSKISPKKVSEASDTQLAQYFQELVDLGVLNGGALTGLRIRNVVDESGRILPVGINALREIANGYELVPVI